MDRVCGGVDPRLACTRVRGICRKRRQRRNRRHKGRCISGRRRVPGGQRRRRRAHAHKDREHRRKDHPVEERCARRCEQRAAWQQQPHEASLVLVEARSDEEPCLPQHPRRADDEGADERQLHVDHQRLERAHDLQRAGQTVGEQRPDEGDAEEAADLAREREEQDRHRHRHHDPEQDPAPELLEMVAEAHQDAQCAVVALLHAHATAPRATSGPKKRSALASRIASSAS